MERERLNRLMQDPSRAGKEDLAGLQELSRRYPWFSAAHLLLAVGEHATGDVLYDERARTAAAHLPSRAVLFDLVHTPPQAPAPTAPAWATVPVIEVPEVPAPVQPVAQPAPPAPEEAVAPVLEVAAPTVEAVAPEHAVAPVPVAPEAPAPPVVEKAPMVVPEAPAPVAGPSAGPVAPAEPAKPEVDPLDQLIRESVYTGTYELLLEHEQALMPKPVAPEPVPMPAPPSKRRFTDWLEQVEPFSTVPSAPASRAVAPSEGATPASRAAGPAPAPAPSPAAPASRAVAPGEGAAPTPQSAAPGEIDAPAAKPEPPAKPKGGMSVSEAASLIDSFIRQETPEPAKRAAFFNPQTAAKRSLEEHAELVTETLAQIYARQGNVAKAKAAYRKLAEKHPERKEHFLTLAKALENPPKP
ncbi:MAG: hypothetical protein JNL05_09900 [Flavobacteriales bacterium]|nr:hypothetical protein [Flavobacteriales bacterium]